MIRTHPIHRHGWVKFFLLLSISTFIFSLQKGLSMTSNIALIPRKVLFGNPHKAMVRISPNGKYLTYLAPVDNVLNVWLQPLNSKEPPIPLTQDTGRGIQNYGWTYDNQHLLYVQDRDGDENWRLFKINIHTKKITTLTDEKNVQVQILATSYKHPNVVFIGLNARNASYHDIYKLDLTTDTKQLVYENNEFATFLVDEDLHLRLAGKMTETGSMNWFIQKDGKWELYRSFNSEDQSTSGPAGLSKDGTKIYWLDSKGRDFAVLTLSSIESKKEKIIATPEKTDFSSATFHPTENLPLWVGEDYLKPQRKFVDNTYKKDFDYLESLRTGVPTLVTSTLDFNQWIVAYLTDVGPVYYYLYNRAEKKADYLFSSNKQLENLPLSRMHPVKIKSRDGLTLVSYLVLPSGLSLDAAKNLPTVLYVHGGPHDRDSWGYNARFQWLANRGYAVLTVNYRGSGGFGKKFLHAGDKQFARKMHDDLIDGVNWLIQKKISDPQKISIFGGSYGGYATLVGMTHTPDVFACGVDIVGPSNLVTLISSFPPYWKPMIQDWIQKIGDPATEEGQALLKERSPLHYIDQIKKPLLIAQGANDPRVKQAESDQIVDAMRKKKIPVTYVLYPDEGHGFVKPANRISFYAIAEKFLGDCLGGKVEPVGEDFKNSSLQVKEGAIQ
jgi:dipeptidyl aminopeptidase/acylaminoacyl peptidase